MKNFVNVVGIATLDRAGMMRIKFVLATVSGFSILPLFLAPTSTIWEGEINGRERL
jgi:hypothetical protein